MPKMKAVQVSKAGGNLEVVERTIPEAGSGQVRIRVLACGVCHSDSVTKEGLFPGITYLAFLDMKSPAQSMRPDPA